MHGISITSSWRLQIILTQYDRRKGNVKETKEYWKIILKNIATHIKTKPDRCNSYERYESGYKFNRY